MSSRRVVWITGAGGLIGSYLADFAVKCLPDWDVVAPKRGDLDLLDETAVRDWFTHHRPEVVFHCAAVSRSPICQADPDFARRVNVGITQLLAQLAAKVGFVLFSSDLVFDGCKANGRAYVEGDPVNPLSVYGETKVEAERSVLINPRHLVIRTSLNGGQSPTGDRGFNEELRRAWRSGRPTRLFVDEFRCPIAASLTARAVWSLVLGGAVGLFHVAGAERLSRWEIGELVAERCPELHPCLERGYSKDYQGSARPGNLHLDCGKARSRLPFPLTGLRTWLHQNPDAPF